MLNTEISLLKIFFLDTREWTCNKFPKWLQKTYKLSGTDFCKAQWDDLFFSSQPNCDHDILPTVAFYDRSDDQYFAEPLCTINMNEAEDGAFGALCPEVDSILNEANEGTFKKINITEYKK